MSETKKTRAITLSEFGTIFVLTAICFISLKWLALPVESGNGSMLSPSTIAGDISALVIVKILLWFTAFLGILVGLRGVSCDLWEQAIGPDRSQPAATIIVGIALALAWVIGR